MSVENISFLHIFNKFLPFLGFMPIIDFSKMEIIYNKQYKMYSLVLTCAMLFFWSNNVLQYAIYYKDLMPLHALTIIISEILCILSYILIIWGSAFWNQNCWLQLLKKSKCMERNWYSNSKLHWYKNGVFLKFILFGIVMFVCFLLNVPYFKKHVQVIYGYKLYYIMMYYFYYVQFLQSFIIYYVCLNIKNKYKNLEREFSSVCKNQLKRSNYRNFGKVVRKLSKTYRQINDILNDFNRLFGWQMLLSSIIVGLFITSGCDLIFLYAIGYELKHLTLNLQVVISNVSFICFFFVSGRFFKKNSFLFVLHNFR